MADNGEYPKGTGDIRYPDEINNEVGEQGRYKLNPNGFNSQQIAPVKYAYPLTFTTDILQTKTNLTYKSYVTRTNNILDHSTMYEYYGEGNNAIVAETYDLETDATIGNCFVRWDFDILEVYDECDDSAIAGGLWTTTGAPSEDTDGIFSSAVGSFKTNDLSSKPMIRVPFSMFSQGTGVAGGTVTLSVLDDTAGSSNIISFAASSAAGDREECYGEVLIYNNDTDDRLIIVVDAWVAAFNAGTQLMIQPPTRQLSTTTVDISTWDGVLRVKGDRAGAALAEIKFFNVRTGTLSPTSSAPTISLSADGGSNYETTLNGATHKFTSTGTELRSKVTGTVAANEVIAIRGVELVPTV